jgi:hypothetical protein
MAEPRVRGDQEPSARFSFQSFDHGVSGRDRETPSTRMSSTGSHPARFADEEGPQRDNDARLQAAWHHDLV